MTQKGIMQRSHIVMLLERLRILAQSDSEKAAQTGDPVLNIVSFVQKEFF